MSQAGIINVSSQAGIVDSVTGTNGVTASPTTGNVVVSGINATTSSVGVASFNPSQFSVTAGAVSLLSSSSASGFYGDGSDGVVTFDGTTVVLGITPSANTYTLSRDIFLASGTINAGISIITNQYRFFCAGTLTNNGTIQWNGNSATSATGAVALNNNNGSFSAGTTTTSSGTAGGNGTTGTGANGTNQSSSQTLGGRGGSGGAGVSAGGVGGTLLAAQAPEGSIRALPFAILGYTTQGNSGAFIRWLAGSGGGGGGGDAVNSGGGGGSGAGYVLLSINLFAGTGNISSIGGNGAAGAVGATSAGGGGGGGGGIISIVSQSVTSGAITGQTLSVAGGNGGTGTGLGATGSNGASGTIILLRA